MNTHLISIVSPKARALIFDLDGTLVDSMKLHYQAWQQCMKSYDIHIPWDYYLSLAGIPAINLVSHLNKKFNLNLDPVQVANQKVKVFVDLVKDNPVKPLHPAIDIVRYYHHKLPMAIGTGGRRGVALSLLESLNILDHFEIIIAAEDVKHHKPHPETFLEAAKYMKVKPEFCQVFEDGDPGLQAARSAGMIATDIRLL